MAVVMSTSVIFLQTSVATAEEPTIQHKYEVGNKTPGSFGEFNRSDIEAAYREMITGGVEHHRHVEDGQAVVTFQLTEGLSWTLPDFDAVQPYVSGGLESGGFYLTFTPYEQDLVIGGGGLALTGLICLIPGVGPIACGMATILVMAAGAAMGNSKPCGNHHYRVSYNWVGAVRSTRCA